MSKTETTQDITQEQVKVRKKHAGGRPTKYKPEYCQRIIEYFDQPNTYEVPVTITKNGTTIEKTEQRASAPRHLTRFAWEIGADIDTVEKWAKRYEGFGGAYARAKQLQEEQIVECGALKLWDSSFSKFVAVNRTSMRDKTEVEHSGNLSLNDAALALGIAQGRKRVESRQIPALPAPNPVSALPRTAERERAGVLGRVEPQSMPDSALETG